jgi:SAM-dependent methyltransferase
MATTTEERRRQVREHYGQLARQSMAEGANCCEPASGCCGITDVNASRFAEDYSTEAGYVADADLGLGCGLPTRHAGLAPGQTVLDLGSGAGNDLFVARQHVGEAGHLIGVDFAPAMVAKARKNARKQGYRNMTFRQGELTALPLGEAEVDVAVSNCVLNLEPEKAAAFAEMYRVLKPGGHFCISDIVLLRELPPALQDDAALYAGCISGALLQATYLAALTQAGFEAVSVAAVKPIALPDELLQQHLDAQALAAFREQGPALQSITVTGYRPSA